MPRTRTLSWGREAQAAWGVMKVSGPGMLMSLVTTGSIIAVVRVFVGGEC